ncbi:hypothetical protein SeMB42_g07297 [Synchytrium endobioticum]|uniref:Transcriptional repressor Tup1 N-terminal domain-containing protein n=1 Tax=Synchytrium endobioticum TaxID=286115 RepID=A0A507C0J7_9FUNG|nr:hypothetical protein SeMB42_g07297 [Synchytrium endobioticum]TPX46615.1 hypothetical protein SeLEV6574_g03140 [Synchytrium endobioticum]
MAADPFDLSLKAEREWSSSSIERNWPSLGSLRKQFSSPSISTSPLNRPSPSSNGTSATPKPPFTTGGSLFLGHKHILPHQSSASLSSVSVDGQASESPIISSSTLVEDADAFTHDAKPPLYKVGRRKSTPQSSSIALLELDTNVSPPKERRRPSSSSRTSKRRDSKSAVLRDSSASTLVDQDIVPLTQAELSSLPMEPQSPQITFYQGFRAVYPQLAPPMTKYSNNYINTSSNSSKYNTSSKHTLLHESGLVKMRYEKLQVRETMEVQIARDASPSGAANGVANDVIQHVNPSALVEMPENVRVHSLSIHNVSRLFTELLNERDIVLHEATKLDTERRSYTDQLRQIEDMLTELNRRRVEVIQRLRQIADREDIVNELLEDLDLRIASIGHESARFERNIRSIKGDSAALDIDIAPKTLPNTCLKTLFGFKDTVECLDFDMPFGTLAAGSADRTIRVYDLSSYRCSAVLSSHTGWVRCVQLRNQTLMSGSGDHTIRQWDLSLIPPLSPAIESNPAMHHSHEPPAIDSEAVCTRVFKGHAGGVGSLAFDDQLMVSGSADKTIRVWDLHTGETSQVLRTEKWIEGVSMTRIDAMVVGHGAREPGSLPPATADVFTDKPVDDEGFMLYNVGGHVAALQFVEFALAAGYGDGLVRLWDLRSGKCHRELGLNNGGHTGAITCLKFDERVIITGGIDKTVKIWDLRVGDVLESINFDTSINDLAFDAWKIAVATSSKDISVYNRSTSSIRILDEGFSDTFSDSHSSSVVAQCGNKPSTASASNSGHSKSVRCLSLVDDMLCSGGLDQVVKIWRVGKKCETT